MSLVVGSVILGPTLIKQVLVSVNINKWVILESGLAIDHLNVTLHLLVYSIKP